MQLKHSEMSFLSTYGDLNDYNGLAILKSKLLSNRPNGKWSLI